jgi:hypothetical protein
MERIDTMIVFGAGCFAHHHAAGLLKGRERGRTDFRRLLLVSRTGNGRACDLLSGVAGVECVSAEWHDFLDLYFGTGRHDPSDHFVPTPYAPHLYFDWIISDLARRPGVQAARLTLNERFGLPYEHFASEGHAYYSFAAWRCPITCIEPDLCPATRGPRDWDMERFFLRLGTERGWAGVEVLKSVHHAWGISTLPARRVLEARDHILASAGGRFLVTTASSCHAAAGLLEVNKAAGGAEAA